QHGEPRQLERGAAQLERARALQRLQLQVAPERRREDERRHPAEPASHLGDADHVVHSGHSCLAPPFGAGPACLSSASLPRLLASPPGSFWESLVTGATASSAAATSAPPKVAGPTTTPVQCVLCPSRAAISCALAP